MKRYFRGSILIILIILAGILVMSENICADEVPIVHLKYWTHWTNNIVGSEEFYGEAAERFNKEHPEVDFAIDVIPIPYGSYEARYMAAFEGGTPPDLLNAITSTWSALGYLEKFPEELDNKITKKLDEISLAGKTGLDAVTGDRYGLPCQRGETQILFINNNMFREAGLDPNIPPNNFEDLVKYAQKLTISNNGRIIQGGFGLRHKGNESGIGGKVMPFLYNYTDKVINLEEEKATGYLNSKEALKAFQLAHDLVYKYKVASTTFPNPLEAFGKGMAAMIKREPFAVSWLQTNAPDIDFSIYPFPSERTFTSPTWSVVVAKDIPDVNKKWAFKFIEWYVDNKDLRYEHFSIGLLPPWKDLLEEEPWVSDPIVDTVDKAISRGKAPIIIHKDCQKMQQLIGKAWVDVLYGRAAPKEAADRAAKGIDDVLEETK